MTKKILVVEDDPAVRHMLVRVLSGEGYLVIPAADAWTAAKLAAREPLDLVVIGIEPDSPNGNINELQLASAGVPMVLAGRKEIEPRHNAARLEKPWDVKVLLEAIRTLLNLSRTPATA